MRNLEKEFSKRAISYDKLKNYGFSKTGKEYLYKRNILQNSFEVNISITENEITSKVIDLYDNTEYALVDVETAVGEFVGTVRQEYEKVINDVIEKCTQSEKFKFSQTKELIKYVKETYGDELEFLWERYDDNAIWRNKKNNKWYAVLLTITEDKLRKNSNKKVEIVDLMYQKEEINKIIDNKKIYPGYHMNKKSWITVILDDSMDNESLFEMLDNSYKISLGGKSANKQEVLAQQVYNYLTTIPKGKVVTYKQVAEHLGNKGLARVVGNILHKNPDEDKYPCYKVVNSKGELSPNFVFGGEDVQRKKLEKEGIVVENNMVNLTKYRWLENN